MSKFIEVMKSLEEMTLTEIDAEIQTLETEMAAAIEPLLKKRNALSVLRKIVAARSGEPVVKRTRKPRKSADTGEATNRAPTIADRIVTALQTSSQPMRVKERTAFWNAFLLCPFDSDHAVHSSPSFGHDRT